MLDNRTACPVQSAHPCHIQGCEFDSSDNRRTTAAPVRFFYVRCMACPVTGGPCGGTREGAPVPIAGLSTPHGLPTRLTAGERKTQPLNRNHDMQTQSAIAPLVFQFQSEAEIRVVTLDGIPHFAGKDVAVALGYANHNDAIKQHCKGVAKRYPLQTPGGAQEVRILAQSDVLRLIVGSKSKSTAIAARTGQNWKDA